MIRPFAPLSRIRPRDDTLYVAQGRSVLATDRDGFIHDGRDHGFFCFETRLLSHYEMLINGRKPRPNVLSNVEQHSWIGYYTYLDSTMAEEDGSDEGSGQMTQESEQTLELRVSRSVGGGVHEDVDLTNFTGNKIRFELTIVVEADFLDRAETPSKRKQDGKKTITWNAHEAYELQFRYEAEREVQRQDFSGFGKISRGITVSFDRFSTAPVRRDDQVVFAIELEPFQTWHTCINWIPKIENQTLGPLYPCHSFSHANNEFDRRRNEFLEEATDARDPNTPYLAPVAIAAFDQAKQDLVAMRLFDLDSGPKAWTMAAGLPIYTAFFGRDTLTAAWQAGLLGPEMMKGTLGVLASNQGKRTVDWTDEEPGRLVHEMHEGPLAKLYYNNHARNFGSVTTSHLFPFMVTQLWHWTGDRQIIEPYIEPALKAIGWMKESEHKDNDGFLYYKTRSKDGVKNQGWKDSPSGVVSDKGTQLDPPIAMCEEQGFAYLSMYFFAELLWSFGRKDEAKRLFSEAREFKKRFNEKFWLDDIGYFAMGLDANKNPIRAIGSDPGHCLAAGLIDASLVERTVERMFEPDLFSGWGMRTLSNKNPAYNPYSYHRGSVWPVESGTFCMGFMRYGLWQPLENLARSFFEMVSLYEFFRAPEVLSGHARDSEHPIPALYPQANSPQAWSSSAVVNIIQSMLGIYPYAPRRILGVNPCLPEWLPQIELKGMRVGDARVSIRFYRKANGDSDYTITDQLGKLRVIRQASPWSMTTGIGERLGDLVGSLLH